MVDGPLVRAGDYWLPAHDQFFLNIFGRGEAFESDLIHRAQLYCKNKRTLIDVGAHVGIWSKSLSPIFQTIHAFEPVYAHQQCFVRNVPDNAYLYPLAVGEAFMAKFIAVSQVTNPDGETFYSANSGMCHINNHGQPVIIAPLDSFGFTEVDLLKIDTEGFELFVLKGAAETIKNNRPVIVVENYGWGPKRYGLETEAVGNWLTEAGYQREHFEEATGEEIWLPSP